MTPTASRTSSGNVPPDGLPDWLTSRSGYPFEPFLLDADQAAEATERYRARGVVVLGEPALTPAIFAAIRQECAEQRVTANWALVGDGQQGAVDQDTVRAHLGPVVRTLMAAGATRALLRQITGEHLIPGWSATCLTYYDQPGQRLGRHRDKVDACRHAMLIYVHARWPAGQPPGPGLKLHVLDPVTTAVRVTVTAVPNRIVLLHGSQLEHYRPALQAGEEVGLIAGCYAPVG